MRDELVARARARNEGCWLYPLGHCVFDGAPIDYAAPGRTPRSPELHHKRSVKTHPWLANESSNHAIGHAKCNHALGARDPWSKVRRSVSGWQPATW